MSEKAEVKRPELTDARFINWCMDTYEDQKEKYLAFSVEQSKWINILEGRLSAIRRPHPILCLVGSTNPEWKQRYRQVLVELTKKGFICQTVVWFKDELENFETYRDLLESIHFQKVRMSEAVVLVHQEAVGKHTKMEMDYAKSLGIPVVTFTTIEETTRELGVLLKQEGSDKK